MNASTFTIPGGPTGDRGCRGFTLIEVLLGILILALGLLGLGAVIPVVVREQRAASDATLGVAVAASAEQYLTRSLGFDPSTPGVTAWDVMLNTRSFSPVLAGNTRYLWNAVQRPIDPGLQLTEGTGRNLGSPPLDRVRLNGEFSFNEATGEMRWIATLYERQIRSTPTSPWITAFDLGGRFEVSIPIADRLWPSPQVQTSESLPAGRDPFRPLFVWDFAARRVPPRAGAGLSMVPTVTMPESVQVAVFVRRLDLNIRVPAVRDLTARGDYTLFGVLTGRVPAEFQRLPVAVDDQGLPTNQGFDSRNPSSRRYSQIQQLQATFDPLDPRRGERDVLLLSSAQPNPLLRLAAIPGQRLVDNLGNVYTVRGVPDPETLASSTRVEVFVEPPVPEGVLRQGDPAATDDNPNVLRQVIFTPQVPAAVRVFTVTRPVLTP